MSHNIEDKISDLIKDVVSSLGFELVKVSLQGPNSKTLEILIDGEEGKKVSVGDCRLVSRNISILLDVENIIADKYYLEVSSCGIERPLVKFKDYVRFLNYEVKIKLLKSVDNRLKYQGIINKAQDDNIELKIDEQIISIDFENIKGGHIVLTDEMFRKLLNPSK
ncbi:MAG: ribosome maturation factor RimP [Janthinobacterium lividum]